MKYPYYIEGIYGNHQRGRYFCKVLSINSYLEVYNTDENHGICRCIASMGKNTDDLFRHKRKLDQKWEVRREEYLEISETHFNDMFSKINNFLNNSTSTNEPPIKKENIKMILTVMHESFKEQVSELVEKQERIFKKNIAQFTVSKTKAPKPSEEPKSSGEEIVVSK